MGMGIILIRRGALAACLLAASPAAAWDDFSWDHKFEEREERIDARQERLDDRVERGEDEGRISERERERIEEWDDRIDDERDWAEDGFGISDDEFDDINALQDRQSRAIRHALRRNGPPDYEEVDMQGRGSYPYKGREFGPGYGPVHRNNNWNRRARGD